ncbi:MAG TPA: HypC/HybG/HupF family hydrogenase formation chaperone [Ignavibacteria bacterium]|jgi:hydrogenase expression/formation protein HypC
MCLAIPAKIISISNETAIAEIGDVKREISLMLLPEAEVNDYVLIHAGYAIQKIDEDEANKTLELLKQMDEFYNNSGTLEE